MKKSIGCAPSGRDSKVCMCKMTHVIQCMRCIVTYL